MCVKKSETGHGFWTTNGVKKVSSKRLKLFNNWTLLFWHNFAYSFLRWLNLLFWHIELCCLFYCRKIRLGGRNVYCFHLRNDAMLSFAWGITGSCSHNNREQKALLFSFTILLYLCFLFYSISIYVFYAQFSVISKK